MCFRRLFVCATILARSLALRSGGDAKDLDADELSDGNKQFAVEVGHFKHLTSPQHSIRMQAPAVSQSSENSSADSLVEVAQVATSKDRIETVVLSAAVELSQKRLIDIGRSAPETGSSIENGFKRFKARNCVGRWVFKENEDLFALSNPPPAKPTPEECSDPEFKEHCVKDGKTSDGSNCTKTPFFKLKDPQNWEPMKDSPKACEGETELVKYTNKQSYVFLVPSLSLVREGVTIEVDEQTQKKPKGKDPCRGGEKKCTLTGDMILIKGAAEDAPYAPWSREVVQEKYVSCAGEGKDKLEELMRSFKHPPSASMRPAKSAACIMSAGPLLGLFFGLVPILLKCSSL